MSKQPTLADYRNLWAEKERLKNEAQAERRSSIQIERQVMHGNSQHRSERILPTLKTIAWATVIMAACAVVAIGHLAYVDIKVYQAKQQVSNLMEAVKNAR